MIKSNHQRENYQFKCKRAVIIEARIIEAETLREFISENKIKEENTFFCLYFSALLNKRRTKIFL